MNTNILYHLDSFKPISLEEMSQVYLMDRIDTKYLTSITQLPRILKEMRTYFKVQIHNQTPIASYATQYLDTFDLKMFLIHHNGRLNRQKIRIRTYLDSHISFLEIKNKNNKGRTKKYRIPISNSQIDYIDELGEYRYFLDTKSLYKTDSLFPSLTNNFKRITFVNNKLSERVTIDLNLTFCNCRNNSPYFLDNIVVLELKQDGWQHSDFKDILRSLRIKRSSFSKYCIGTVLTNPAIKSNLFKEKLNLINKYYYYDTLGF